MDDATNNAEDLITRIKDSTDTFRRHQCRHTKPEGGRCGSPAMRGEKFCYHHHLTRRPIADARLRQARRNAFDMPTPNSRAEIQQSLGRIIDRVAGNDIDLRRAGLLLYALQLASTNLTEHQRHPAKNKPEPEQAQPEHPHYGTGPRPQFAPNGEPISTIQTTTEPSEDSAPDFTPPPAKWHRLQQGTGRLLLEQLGRHHSKDNPLPGKPEDRRNTADEGSSQPEGPTHDVSSRPELIPTHNVSFRPRLRPTHDVSFRPERSGVEKPASLPLTPEPEPLSTIQAAASTHQASFRAKRGTPAFLRSTPDAPQPSRCPNAKSTRTPLTRAAKTKAHTNTSPATPQRSTHRTPSSSRPQIELAAKPTRRSPHRQSARGQWRGKGQTESQAEALLHRSPTRKVPQQQKRKEPTSHRFASPSFGLGSTMQPIRMPAHKAQTAARQSSCESSNETPGSA